MNEPEPPSPAPGGGPQEAFETAKDRATSSFCPTGDCPAASLYSVAIVALVVGFLAGILCRRKEVTLQEKYLEAPLNDLRKAITSLSTVAAKKAAGGGEVAADMIDALSDKIRSVVKSL